MTELLVGCPVLHREWILPDWFDAVERACIRAEVKPSYVFVGDPSTDPDTWGVIGQRAPGAHAVVVDETKTDDVRDWANRQRFHRMVELRNLMLGAVRAVAPRWFLSLDSDILLHPDALVQLLDAPSSYVAVGSKCYLGVGFLPNYAMLSYDGGLERVDAHGLFPVDAIMAIKLMQPIAYAVDYEYHRHGEDIGWSLAVRRAGHAIGWTGVVASTHVMTRDMLRDVGRGSADV